LAETVINLLSKLHFTIFFDKPYFFTIRLECHQEKLRAKFTPRGEPISLHLLCYDGSQGEVPQLHPSRLAAAATLTRE
jgi:hypothetical protein